MFLFDYDSYDAKEVTNPSYDEYKPGGLYSIDVFGPIVTNQCLCKKIGKPGEVCNKCGMTFEDAALRDIKMGKIKLPFPILHPKLLYRIGKNLSKDILMPSDRFKKKGITDIENINTFYDLHKLICTYDSIKSSIKKFEENNLLYTNYILVPPPSVRPKIVINGKEIYDDISILYRTLINTIISINSGAIGMTKSGFKDSVYAIYMGVLTIIDHILKIIPKKDGIIRSKILGRRSDYSGRCVIVPDPSLPLDSVNIPYRVLVDLLRPLLVYEIEHTNNNIIDESKNIIISNAEKIIQEYCNFRMHDKLIEYHINKLCKNNKNYDGYDLVIPINRQPSLHRLSLMAFKIIPINESVIKINPAIVKPFNADFDGDQMALYMPLSKEAQQEAREKMTFNESNFLSASDDRIIFKFDQDIVLGLYKLYKTSGGKKLLVDNFNFPDDGEKLTGKVINTVLYNLCKAKRINDIHKLMNIALTYITYNPTSIPLHYFNLPEIIKKKKNLDNSNIFVSKTQEDMLVEEAKSSCKLADIIDSGSRGSWDNIKQISIRRGFISDPFNNIIRTPINNSLIEGLTEEELFISCHGARKGLIDTAENVAPSGYLTRKLVYLGSGCRRSSTDDCGTTDHLVIQVTDKNIHGFNNRYKINDDGSLEKIHKKRLKLNDIIKLRSPLRCKSPDGICNKCLGDIFYNSTPTINIGILAGVSLGEISTQLVLRTFHFSGSANIKANKDNSNDDVNYDINNDLKIVESIFNNKYNTESIKTVEAYVTLLYNIFSSHNQYLKHIILEIIFGELLYSSVDDNIQYRFLSDTEKNKFKLVSINTAINKKNVLVGLLFENFGNNLTNIIKKNKNIDKDNIIYKLFMSDYKLYNEPDISKFAEDQLNEKEAIEKINEEGI